MVSVWMDRREAEDDDDPVGPDLDAVVDLARVLWPDVNARTWETGYRRTLTGLTTAGLKAALLSFASEGRTWPPCAAVVAVRAVRIEAGLR
jgi:hypothetical protein